MFWNRRVALEIWLDSWWVGGHGGRQGGGQKQKDHTKNVQSLSHGSVLSFWNSVSAFV